MIYARARAYTVVLVIAAVAPTACRTTQPQLVVADPVETPPLPPASGTPIGILRDEGAKLQLRTEQVDQLRAIDEQLASRNDQLDSELRELDRPPESPQAGGPGGGMGGPPGGGGMGGGGMGGGGMGGPSGGGRGPSGGGPPPGGHGDPATRRRLIEERATNIRAAIAKALDILDAQQRSVALQILDEHGAADPSRLPPPPGALPSDGDGSMRHGGPDGGPPPDGRR